MFYFIGGPARCGKTTLAKMARKEIDGQVISADGMMTALQDNLQADWIPDLFHRVREIVDSDDPASLKVKNVRKRDRIVWDFLVSYFKEAEFSQDDVLVEGTIWADLLADFHHDHKAVFLVDTSEKHFDRLIEIKNSDTHSNWMKDIDDEKIARYAQFNVERSKEHIRQCKEFGYPYFDIKEHGIGKVQQLALDYLVG